jgi:hypothetical protein
MSAQVHENVDAKKSLLLIGNKHLKVVGSRFDQLRIPNTAGK